jgi:hypothetical protein
MRRNEEMKKSEMYHTLQLLVVKDYELNAEPTLEILRELFAQEDLAKYREEHEEEQE